MRIASIVVVTANKRRLDPNENEDIQARLLDTAGNDAPEEWDEFGNAIRYKTVVQLKRKDPPKPAPASTQPSPRAAGRGARGAQKKQEKPVEEPPKLYDISKLRLEKFHHVLHYCYTHCKDKVVSYQQPEPSLLEMAQNQDGSFGRPNNGLDRDTDLGIEVSPLIDDQSPHHGGKRVDIGGGRQLDVRADLIDSEEEKLSPQRKKLSAMEVTLGASNELNSSDLRNDPR